MSRAVPVRRWAARPEAVEIVVRVQPKASSEGIVGWVEDALKIRLTAPPVEGKANKALQRFLAGQLRIPKRDVEIVAGQAARLKRVRLKGVTPEDLQRALPEVFGKGA
jgi:uncharacterized protein (TIGR00251 family)